MKIKKKKTLTIAALKKRVQKVCNEYIRKRDSKDGYFTCISCGKVKTTDHLHAGHFIAISKSQFLRFNEWNLNGECDGCNLFDETHLIWYEENLVKKIGIDGVEYLKREAKSVPLYKWTRDKLIEVENYYKSLTNGKE